MTRSEPPARSFDAPTLPTRELVERYRHGDRAAEHRLFGRHRARLVELVRGHRWARGLVAYATPEDVVDEVFLRALGSGVLARWNDPETGALQRALFAIAQRVMADIYRRHGALKRGGFGATGDDAVRALAVAPSEATTPTARVRTSDLMEVCRRVLGEREWEVFRLRQVEGLEPAEIAARVGTTASAVRGVWHRARIKVASALAAERTGEGN